MSEEISIREAARRLGVSDTAVKKAETAGRVTLIRRPGQQPRAPWPAIERQWHANTDTMKRSHVGSQGGQRRAKNEPKLGTSGQAGQDAAEQRGAPPGGQEEGPGVSASYAKSRAVREAYQARLAKLEFDQKSGALVPADEVKAAWQKIIGAAKTRIMGIPAACKARASDLPLAVVAVIEATCREALEDLANGRN